MTQVQLLDEEDDELDEDDDELLDEELLEDEELLLDEELLEELLDDDDSVAQCVVESPTLPRPALASASAAASPRACDWSAGDGVILRLP